MPARVVVFCGWNTRLAPARKPRNSTPLISVMTSTTTIGGADEQRHLVVEMPAPDEVPGHRLDGVDARTRDTATQHAADEHGDDQGAQSSPSVPGPSMPITADTCRCHAAAGISISTLAAVDSATVAAFSQYSTRFAGGHQVRRA